MKKYQYLASWDDQTLTRVGEPVVVRGDSNVSQVEVTLPSNFLLDPTKAECRMYFLLPGEKESDHDVLEAATKDENGDSHVTWTIKHVHSQKGGRLAFSLTLIGDNAQWDSRTAIIPVYESRYQPESEEAEEPYTGRLDALEGSMAAIRGEFAEVQDDFEELKETATLGAPIPKSLASEMVEGGVYLYTGTEPGYTAGHVYYYVNGTLTDGGQYGGIAIDDTLTSPTMAAPASEVGQIKEDLSALGDGLSEEAKAAILNCVSSMAWADTTGRAKYNALVAALDPHAYPLSITAVYTQSGAVYPFTPLDNLKADLVVTASMSDGTTQTISGSQYTLSGTLTEGTSTITVTYSGKTTTFEVTVSAAVPLTISNALLRATTSNATTQAANGDAYTATITPETGYAIGYAKVTMGGVDITSTAYSNGVISIPAVTGDVDIRVFALYTGASVPAEYTEYDYIEGLDSAHSITTAEVIRTPVMAKSLDSVDHEFLYERKSGAVETSYTERLFGSRKSANSLTGATLYYTHNGYINPYARGNGTLKGSALDGVVHCITCTNGATSPSIVSVDGTSYEMAWNGETSTAKSSVAPFCGMMGVKPDGASRMGQNRLGRVTIYDEGTPILDLRPVIRISDNRIGWYNTVTQAFMTCTSETAATVGAEGCLYAVGNWG